MLKQATVILLLLAIFGQTFNRAVLVASYYTNTVAFAKNCENKAKPKMHCNGKCQMFKKMRQEDNKDKQSSERLTISDVVISSKSFFIARIQLTKQIINLVYPEFISPSLQHFTLPIFHPPGA